MSRDLWAIGDIHGCRDAFHEVLRQITEKSTTGADIVILGDMIDRGPDSKGVVDDIRAGHPLHTYIVLKGNHEDLMTKALGHGGIWDMITWVDNGGDATRDSYSNDIPEETIEWMHGLPVYHETDNHVFVHAGAYPYFPISEQHATHLMWMRKWEDDEYDTPWTKHIVYGHTPDPDGPVLRLHCTNLDTGACFGYQLTAARFDRALSSGPIEVIQVSTDYLRNKKPKILGGDGE